MSEQMQDNELDLLEPIILDLLKIIDPEVTLPMFLSSLAHKEHIKAVVAVAHPLEIDIVRLARYVAKTRKRQSFLRMLYPKKKVE